MSTASAVGAPAIQAPQRQAPVRHWLRLFRSELRNVFLRPRNLALLAVISAAPVFLGIVMWINTPAPGSGGPGAGVFVGQIAENGVFLSLFAIYVLLTVLLPLAVSVVAGDSVAGEAGLGTLRTLLTVPAGRTRLLLTKYLTIVVFCLTATVLVAGLGLLMGAIFFPVGPVTLLSGTTVSLAAGLGRLALIVCYVAAALSALGAIGLALSTFTQHAIAVMATVLVLVIVSEILDGEPGGGHSPVPSEPLLVLVRRTSAYADRVVGGAARARVVRRVHRDLRRDRVDQNAARQRHLLKPPRGSMDARGAVAF